ncbi:MAG: hypothetical protein AAF902_10275 [Chloroflexota bacterium]
MDSKAFPAVIADILGLLLIPLFLIPVYGASLTSTTVQGGSILFIVFLLVAFGINQIKRLELKPGKLPSWFESLNFTRNQQVMIGLALSLVVVFVLAQVNLNNIWGDTVDLFENTGEVHEGEMTLYITFGPIFIWFMAGAFYLIGFSLPTEKVIETESNRYWLTEFVVLLLINVLVGMFALFLAGWFGRFFPSVGVVGKFLFVWAALEFLFIPTRLRHVFKNPSWLSIGSFLLVILGAVIFVV